MTSDERCRLRDLCRSLASFARAVGGDGNGRYEVGALEKAAEEVVRALVQGEAETSRADHVRRTRRVGIFEQVFGRRG